MGMKIIMRRFGSVALAALTLGAVCFTPAEAAYKPKITSKMGRQAMKDVQKAVATLKAMPKPIRWTFYAEKLGLLFMPPNGARGHDSKTGNMLGGSHFIGVDGMEYDAKAEFDARPSKEAWGFCALAVERLGREVVFSKVSSEVTALVLENAKYHLEKMAEEQPERRDMYLAFTAKLCYLPDGKSPYGKLKTRTGPHKQPVQCYELDRSCLFVDTEGTEHKFDDVAKKYADPNSARWWILDVCVHHVGRKDILALCPDEVKKLRANYKKKMQELGVSATEPKEDKEVEETSAPSEKAESLAKKLGVTYRPKTNADRMGGQFKKDLDSVVSYLKSLPKTLRWSFIAERMGLMFMPQDGGNGYGSNGWFENGAHFIGANGLEYDSRAEVDARPSIEAWRSTSVLTDRLGREVVFSKLPDEAAELVLQTAKYHLDKLTEEFPEGRDAVLARIAQLEYLPDGTSSYILRSWKGAHGDKFNEYMINADPAKYCFTDTEGKEHLTDVVYLRIKGRWSILIICAHHLGADAILALCPEEVKQLRANYEKKMQELGVDTTEAKENK